MASYGIGDNWGVTVNANNLANKKSSYCELATCRYGGESPAPPLTRRLGPAPPALHSNDPARSCHVPDLATC